MKRRELVPLPLIADDRVGVQSGSNILLVANGNEPAISQTLMQL